MGPRLPYSTQVKTSKARKRPRSSGVCSPASPRREARPTRQPGPHQPCAKRRTAQARLRPARVGEAAPRPSQAPSGPRRPQPSLAPSQASGVDAVPAAWSRGPHDGAMPGNRHLTRTGPVRSAVLRTAFSQQERTRGLLQRTAQEACQVEGPFLPNNRHAITFISAFNATNTCLDCCLLWPDVG